MEDRHVVLVDLKQSEPQSSVSRPPVASGLTTAAQKWSIRPNLTVFGIFDGHGGPYAAEFCSKRFGPILSNVLATPSTEVAPALITCFEQCDKEFIDVHRTRFRAGTTALAAAWDADKHELTVANCGDCRAVLCRDDKAIPITVDHRLENDAEKERVRAAGGVVGRDGMESSGSNTVRGDVAPLRVYTMTGSGGLAVSRSIGDAFLKNVPGKPPVGSSSLVIATPDVYHVAVQLPRAEDPSSLNEQWRQCDRFVILATDGVWDVFSDQEACDVIIASLAAGCGPTAAASALVDAAYDRGSQDNISVTLIVFGVDGRTGVQSC
jgi:serine/threonine protein phosphatase PrpC